MAAGVCSSSSAARSATIAPAPRRHLLAGIAATLEPGDDLLLGTDLVKDPARLVTAYDDPAGVTAAFNRNVLAVINRELGVGLRPRPLRARRPLGCRQRVDRDAVAVDLRPQRVDPGAGASYEIGSGEEILTEISAKFRRRGIQAELAAAGFDVVRSWTDDAGDFAITLGRADRIAR